MGQALSQALSSSASSEHQKIVFKESLRKLESNSSDVRGLVVSEDNWIKRAGKIIRKSNSLHSLKIVIQSGDEDGAWLGQLLRHLPHNRSIKSLTVDFQPGEIFGDPHDRSNYTMKWDIFHMLSPFLEHNKNLRNIDLGWGTASILSLAAALATCNNKQLECIHSHFFEAGADFGQLFSSLSGYDQLTEICVGDGQCGIGKEGFTALSNLLRNPCGGSICVLRAYKHTVVIKNVSCFMLALCCVDLLTLL